MLNSHFFAVFATVFCCFIGTIDAQKDKKTFTQEEFEQLVADDAPQAYQLAVDRKLNFDQLEFFIGYELGNERNFQYLDTLNEIYWQQLTHKDKLNFQRIQFVQEYSYLSIPEGQPYQFARSLAYVIQHQNEYKKVWGDSLYNRFILDYINVGCHEINLHPYTEEVEPFNIRTAKAEKFLQLIKNNLPDYENRMRSDIYCRCVYDHKTEAKQYYNAIDEFLTQYESNPDNFTMYASDLVRADVDIKYKKMGLKWLDKAIELENDPSNIICKAELLQQLGKNEEAEQTLLLAKPQAYQKDSWLKDYYQRVERLIETSK